MNDADDGHGQPGKEVNGTEETSTAVPGAGEPDEQKKAYADLNDRFLRLAADFENYKKRSERDRASLVAMANERFAIDLLEVLDNMDRALKADDAHLHEGVVQIHQLLNDQMLRHGVRPIDSLKKTFNPAEHEAIAHVPSDEPAGTIIDEISRGYRMHERVIRFAKVAVSKGNLKDQEA
ncbi:MAG: nucleotide exchange factor GrpE [Methanoregula sp.]|jgi:molecular chaperone GrpE|uniref:nucleotide exchange factor GrpE n=1 Tax=Methanoregula sp. TaxID=2052170 RepID=UPI0025DDA93D|nr:nucleotide exchange factor GrpE [Methanoregula sp.]MCK9632071.1 nucleotide exchange factor GrpE [Methanoregula sp.]